MFEKFEIGPRENFFQGKNIFFQNLIFNKKDKIEFEKKMQSIQLQSFQ